jgi:cytochrome c-type biogenesis protein CcmH
MLKKLLFITAVLVAALAAAAKVSADEGTPGPVTDDDVNRVAKQLYCPVCENIPLDVCPTQACAQWRATIREKLQAGWGDQQILDYFEAQYGERVLAKPSTRGINVLMWLVPPIVVLGGAFFLWRYLQSTARAAPAAGPGPAPEPADEYVNRLERELKKRM